MDAREKTPQGWKEQILQRVAENAERRRRAAEAEADFQEQMDRLKETVIEPGFAEFNEFIKQQGGGLDYEALQGGAYEVKIQGLDNEPDRVCFLRVKGQVLEWASSTHTEEKALGFRPLPYRDLNKETFLDSLAQLLLGETLRDEAQEEETGEEEPHLVEPDDES